MVLLLAGVSLAGLTITSYSVSQESFKPGSNGVITITVGSSSLADKLITGVDTDVYSPTEIVMKGGQFIGDIEPGGSTTISLPFKVASDAKSSIYTVQVEFIGVSDRPTGGFDIFQRRLSLPITVVDAPIFTLSSDNQLIGGIDELTLTIKNNGGKATNLKVSLPNSSKVGFYGFDEVFIKTVNDSVSVDVTLDSRDAANGPIDVPFIFQYEDELGIVHTSTTKLRMTVRNEPLDLTILQKTPLVTRNESTFTLEVKNDGEETLKDLRIGFDSSGSFRLTDSKELKFGDLKPNESASATALVFADLPPGVNLIDSTVKWIEKDVSKEEDRSVPLTITSDAEVGVYLEAKPLPLTIGQDHTLSVLVSNLGSYSIENVDVSVSSPALRPLDISDIQYIGGLQTDDFSTVQFQVRPNASSAGTYPVDVTVNYRDQSGEWRSEQIRQNITVYNGTQEEGSPLPLLVGVALLAVIIWWFKLRKPSK